MTIPLSLYIHIPWCVRKCPYCDFNSHDLKNSASIPEQEYLNALIADFDQQCQNEPRTHLHSVFFGGGTPSLMSPRVIGDILDHVSKRFSLDDIEITMEANPGTFDQSNFSGYRAAGVNRLSIGAQSFSDKTLVHLGRIHESNDTIKAFDGARKAGFDRLNIDLIHGVEGQTAEDAVADLETAAGLGAEHISWYELTIEPNTVFYRYPPRVPEEDVMEDMSVRGQQFLSDAGYNQYEISAYAQSGEQSQHNLNYWLFGDYLGIGAGAHGKLSSGSAPELSICRTSKTRVPSDYLGNHLNTQTLVVPQDELMLEFLMNSLRLNEGFSPDLFENRTGLSRETLFEKLHAPVSRGWIEPLDRVGESDQQICVSGLGRQFLNTLLTELS